MPHPPLPPPPTAASAAVGRWRIGTVLLWLVLACLLPGMLGFGLLFARQYAEEQARLENDLLTTARALVRAVDNQLYIARASALALAASEHLAQDDLSAFHEHARQVLAATGTGMNVVVSDLQGQQVLNTLRAPGEPLPHHGNPDAVRQVVVTEQPVISHLYTGGVLNQPVLSVDVPVRRGGQVHQVLSLGLLPSSFDGILAAQRFPEEQLAVILDPTGTIAARTLSPAQYVGQKGTGEYVTRILASPEGAMKTQSREGVRMLSVWSRSTATDWSVGIGITQATLERDLQHKLSAIALTTLGMLGLGLLLAWMAANRIALSLRALSAQAEALREASALPELPIHLTECAEVSTVLHQTAHLLTVRAAELNEAHRLAGFGAWRYQPGNDGLKVSDSVRELLDRDVSTFTELRGTVFDEATWWTLKTAFLNALRSGESCEMELRAQRPDGRTLWLLILGEPVRDARGLMSEAVATRTASLTAANEALQQLSHTDALTQLHNRLSTNDRLRQEFLRMKRHGQPYAVLFIDIDHFKRVNDTYGHETGDEVLRQLARVLKGAARATDFVARYGGEEFLVLLPDTHAEGARTLAEKIRQAVSSQVFPVVGELTVSVGVSLTRGDDKNEEEAVHRADMALYRAKSEGRNRVCCG
jgi:diguanylate cyclase (GGDEF)-like protein